MRTIKVAEATPKQLNYLVAVCKGYQADVVIHAGNVMYGRITSGFVQFSPAENWAQGGPIIEREINKAFRNVGGTWSAMILKDVPIPTEERGTSLALTQRMQWNGAGNTPLIAAMRCYCISKLGETAEVPEELV